MSDKEDLPIPKADAKQKLTSLKKTLKEATRDEAPKESHAFWETQPVPKLAEDTTEGKQGPLESPDKEIRKEPYNIPDSFTWVDCDVHNADEMKEIYTLLSENYVEDDDAMFRFDYKKEFLEWALLPPGWKKVWHAGIRVKASNKLVAFITGIPADVEVYGKKIRVVEINFLCVHKKLRSKRLAPVLIKEITRRVNLEGIFQAVYTAGIVLPSPIGSSRYWHRSLEPRKLIDVQFSHLSPKMTMKTTERLYKLPEEPEIPGLRPLEEKDIPQAYKLVSNYIKKFALHPVWSKEEFKHWFLPRENVIYAYVVEAKDGKITDFCSFYSLPSSILNHPKHQTLFAAYSYYNVATSVPLKELMNDALTMAKKNGFDVFNALDIQENAELFKDLKFGIGDGHLQYYLFNWRTLPMEPSDIGLVLL